MSEKNEKDTSELSMEELEKVAGGGQASSPSPLIVVKKGGGGNDPTAPPPLPAPTAPVNPGI